MTDIDTIVADRIKRYKCVEFIDVPLLSWTKIDLWEELKNPEGHIQLIFQENPNKLFITGDFGSFIFGKDIVHIYNITGKKNATSLVWHMNCYN